ncbi:unnamed protein product [Rotaria socialis]|uniref:Uncharacterized protein n=1 Tax=Rotaria socialis TaxID=392032 RepID=A0A817TA21_9BILA|nr:unnamed protein product [Rotaria socialis]CAF3311795.1 unnamed protein product [Rotaria socialis]CAF3385450.1 unnamed protein product [Rotaria socialis]CAF3478106.1 unnamed protein product [Rotaria socialis]CAF3595582.1 unnamed protein product [Rotaria socialis]
MARNHQDIRKEIQRIEGQLLVAKQICRENLKEINRLKIEQENDFILQEINRLLSIKSLNSNEHIDQFNQLLHLVYQQQKRQTITLDNTVQLNKQDEQYHSLLIDLSSNITELESLFDYGKNLITEPITSVNLLSNTVSLQEISDDSSNDYTKTQDSIQITDLQKRIDTLSKRLTNIHQCDDCLIQ